MNLKRLLLVGVVVTIFNAIYGFVTCGWLFNWVYQLPPVACWRDMENVTPLYWALVYLGNFIIVMIYTTAYAKVGGCFAGGKAQRGAVFGFALWFVAMLPGMFYTYAFMNVAAGVILYWLFQGLIQLIVIGLLIAWIYPLPEHTCCCEKSA